MSLDFTHSESHYGLEANWKVNKILGILTRKLGLPTHIPHPSVSR